MHFQELLCFGTLAGEGNPALVVQQGPADPALRQAFASAQQHPASVFLERAGQAPAAPCYVADYYYPHARSPLCLHATLAAAHVLFKQQGSDVPITLATAMHGQQLRLTREGELYFIALAPQALAPLPVDTALAAALLGMPDLAPCSPPRLASVGSAKLLIEVDSRAALYALRPPLDKIVDWGRAHGVNGCYVYCRIGERVYEGRNFNHRDPALEDGATGVAAGALAAHLGHGLTLYQGQASGRACVLHARLDGKAVLVGGRVEEK